MMEQTITTSLSAIEALLTTLTDSITAYQPSLPTAEALLAADTQLSTTLQLLSQHQRNHARLVLLRQQSRDLDAQTTRTLTRLASTRQKILDTKVSASFQDMDRAVPYDELLRYGANLAKYAPPRMAPPPPPPPAAAAATSAPQAQQPLPSQQLHSSASTQTQPNTQQSLPPSTPFSPHPANPALSKLTLQDTSWLTPTGEGGPPLPWPNEAVTRRSALAQLQVMIERGEDLSTARPPGVGEEGGEGVNGEGKGEGSGGEAAMEGVANGDSQPRRDGGVGRLVQQVKEEKERKAAVFGGLDLYDPDMEED
jgi:hypothetical protein